MLKRFLPAAAAVFIVLGAQAGLAGWRSYAVSGTPTDLQVQDAGHVVVTTSAGGFDLLFSADGGVQDAGAVLSASAVGAWHDYDGGRLGVLTSGALFLWPTGGPIALPNVAGAPYNRMRQTSSGMGYAIAIGTGLQSDLVYSPSGGADGGWHALGDNTGRAGALSFSAGGLPMSTLTLGAADYALFADDGTATLMLAVDAGFEQAFSRFKVPLEVHLFANGAGPGALIVPSDGGLEWVPQIAQAGASFLPVALPAAAQVRGVTFSLEGGDRYGRGFGVATGTVSGAAALLRSVPNPADAGWGWVAQGMPLVDAGVLERVACLEATFCAALVKVAHPKENLLVYWNQHPPWLAMPSTVSMSAAAGVTLVADAGDLDGDPVFVSWLPADGGVYPLQVQSLDLDGRRVTVTTDAGSLCGTPAVAQYPYRVSASDGLSSHRVEAPFTLEVVRLGPVGAPRVTPVSVAKNAADPPFDFTASPGDGGCPPTAYGWSEVTDSGFLLVWDGGPTATFHPALSCVRDGGHAQYEVRAYDGTIASLPMTVEVQVSSPGGGAPLPPRLSQAAVSVGAGDPPVTIAAIPADGGCAPDRLVWRELTDAGFRFEADGGGAIFYPPAQGCSPEVGVYGVQAVNGVGTSGTSVVTVSVAPWGAPNAPVFAPATQTAGSGEVLYRSLDAGHLCAAAPVAMEVYFDGGGPLGIAVDGVGAAVRVSSSTDCVDGPVSISARHRVEDAGSAWADLQVLIQTELAPLGDGGFDLHPEAAPAGKFRGTLSVGGNCPERRQLSAEIAVARQGEDAGAARTLPVPTAFELDLPGGCGGGPFLVTARLLSAGVPTGLEVSHAFVAPRQEARLGPVAQDTLSASCGNGASGVLEMFPPPGEVCLTQTERWEQLDGPVLEQPVVHGRRVTLQTAQTGLDDLIGRELKLRLTGEAGPGNTASAVKAVTIIAEPRFVSVRHRADSPMADELGVVSMAVMLTNESDCAVTGASFHEELDGLSFVEGTARYGGEGVDATAEGGVLRFEGLDLPARSTRELVYSARPPLLGNPAPSGQARLRGVAISGYGRDGLGAPERGPPRGCGCAGAGSEMAAAALGLLVIAAVQRRRRSARR